MAAAGHMPPPPNRALALGAGAYRYTYSSFPGVQGMNPVYGGQQPFYPNGQPAHHQYDARSRIVTPPLQQRGYPPPPMSPPCIQHCQNYGYATPPYTDSVPGSPVGGTITGPPARQYNGRPRASSRSSGSSMTNSISAGETDASGEDIANKYNRSAKSSPASSQTSVFPRPSTPDGASLCANGYDNSPCEPVLAGPHAEDTSPRLDRGASNSRSRRRPPANSASGDAQSKFRKASKGREPQDTYVLRCLDEDLPPVPATSDINVSPLATLTDEEYRQIFNSLNTLFCRTSFRWLAQYKFRIPRKRYMKDHVFPEDRELTEYVQIIKALVEGRDVPRGSVRDERINELVSVMEGASEIRHVTIHVSRKQKPDRRVLGFIAAVSEFCWILGDARGAIESNMLYAETEALTMKRRTGMEQNATTAVLSSHSSPTTLIGPELIVGQNLQPLSVRA